MHEACRARAPESESRLIEAMAYTVGTIHGRGFARIFATNTFARNPADHASVRELGRDIITRGFAILNDMLSTESYLSGHYSVADPVLFYGEFWADKTNIALPENLVAHYTRMLTRPAVQRVARGGLQHGSPRQVWGSEDRAV